LERRLKRGLEGGLQEAYRRVRNVMANDNMEAQGKPREEPGGRSEVTLKKLWGLLSLLPFPGPPALPSGPIRLNKGHIKAKKAYSGFKKVFIWLSIRLNRALRRLSRALDKVSIGLLIRAYSGLNKGLLGPSIRLN